MAGVTIEQIDVVAREVDRLARAGALTKAVDPAVPPLAALYDVGAIGSRIAFEELVRRW